jgi:hypothetical protein
MKVQIREAIKESGTVNAIADSLSNYKLYGED